MGEKKRASLPCMWLTFCLSMTAYGFVFFFGLTVLYLILWCYFQLLGFFAGIHLAILAAFVCIMHPHATLSSLFNSFFDIFSHWHWPLPVSLLDQPTPWRPHCCSFMPIVMPCSPPEFCASSITRSTFNKIKEELQRGFALTKVCWIAYSLSTTI